MALEHVPEKEGIDHKKRLLQREQFWIFKLQSLQPMGLNERFEFH